MKKLALLLEEMEVESFETISAAKDEEGTVKAHGESVDEYTCDPRVGTCFGYTCYLTCDPKVGTCFGYTCYDTCP